ncbi:hypothetical protein TNCV_2471971 [Trichonephila clavipes]|nr:hypothetical protein TNCV_2471971 [Trichonephila clavipes]
MELKLSGATALEGQAYYDPLSIRDHWFLRCMSRCPSYVKSLVYADKPQTLDHLEDNIRRVIADIRPQMLENSSKIGRPYWTTSEPAVSVVCQKSYLKCNATRLSFE